MTCTQTDLTKATMTIAETPVNVASASMSGTRWLMLSDSPETLSTTLPTQSCLWHDDIDETKSKTSITYRVFVWHLNNTGGAVKLGLTLKNRSTTNSISISSGKKEIRYSSDYLSVGLCTSKACLGGTMDTLTPVDSTIAASATGIISQATFQNNILMGAIYEFTISRVSGGTGYLNFILRTVASKDTAYDLKNIISTPVSNDGIHPRGTWENSEINATTPTYTVGGTGFYNVSAGGTSPDNLYTAAESHNSAIARTSTGHYGVKYNVTIPVSNTTGSDKTVRIRLNPRGGTYAGAFKNSSGTTRGIPTLYVATPKEVVNPIDFTVPSKSSGTTNCTFSLMHAGGATTALGVYVKTI